MPGDEIEIDLSTGEDDGNCPGCDEPIGDPAVPGVGNEDGVIWHLRCLFAESDGIDRVATALVCPRCRSRSRWRPDVGVDDARICPMCRHKFDGGGH